MMLVGWVDGSRGGRWVGRELSYGHACRSSCCCSPLHLSHLSSGKEGMVFGDCFYMIVVKRIGIDLIGNMLTLLGMDKFCFVVGCVGQEVFHSSFVNSASVPLGNCVLIRIARINSFSRLLFGAVACC